MAAAKPRVLCVDDEPNVLESLRDTLRKRFDVAVTTNGFEGLRMLKEERFEVLVSDMRMPMINGARFLSLAREHAPDTMRLLLTGQSALDDAVTAINDGEIFRFLVKPCESKDLIAALDAAVVRHRALVGRREFDEESARGVTRTLLEVARTLDPSAPERAERIAGYASELASEAESFVPTPELRPSCELMQLGVITMSREALTQLNRGQRLTREQAAELERLPEIAHPLLASNPALRSVAVLLAATTEKFVPTSPGVAGTPVGARILRIVLDFDALERQGVPPHTALLTMRERAGRYDPALLDTFSAVLNLTA